MSYAKAMKHWRNPRKFKMTATKKRGNQLIFGSLHTCPRCCVERSQRIAGNALKCLNCHAEWNFPVTDHADRTQG